MKLRTLLVDDEDHALERLRQLCAAHPEVRIIGEARSGAEAIELVRAHAPALIFLDVHLGSMSGFDMLSALEDDELPHVVMMTAYDSYATTAFERDAIDYLLKPCTPERFARALAKVQARMERGNAPTRDQLVAAWREVAGLRSSGNAHRDGLFIEDGGRWVFVACDSIDYIEAARNYVVIHSAGRSLCHRATISSLEERLDPARFARIHKSVIVNLERVESIESDFNGTYVLRIAGGNQCRSGQSYRSRIQELLRPTARARAPA